MTSRGASDFHLTVGRPPMLRVSGAMEPIRYRTLVEADYVELVRPIVPAAPLGGVRGDRRRGPLLRGARASPASA